MARAPQLRLGERAAGTWSQGGWRPPRTRSADHAEDVECAVCSCPAFESPVQTVPRADLSRSFTTIKRRFREGVVAPILRVAFPETSSSGVSGDTLPPLHRHRVGQLKA
eukprot:TRINITY_DN13353_c0_g1_i1.p2 TRINITY_DN13353_c0_g1~~TRINITY_DN13353_c0_g1_i1.p2  ORF type:complete len:109 (+),score=10.36 TRINITY_DN13353_c0_g1_i1:72-398(+)